MFLLLLFFYSHLHLLLSVATLLIDCLLWQQHHSFPYCLRYFEEHAGNDRNTFAIIWDDCVSKNIVGHVPLNKSKVAFRFFQFANYHIRLEAKDSIVVLDWDSKYK